MEKIKNPLLTTAEAAAYLGLKISYLHKLMMRHAIPYYKPMGKLCFFSQADLDHWLTCNRIASQKEIEQQAQQYQADFLTHLITSPVVLCCDD